jgi:hypothetical protein
MSICDTIRALIAIEPPLPSFPGVYQGTGFPDFLWPSPGPSDMASGARAAVQNGFGQGMDRGELRRNSDGTWSYLEFGNVWIPFIPSNRLHYVAVSARYRYGIGWSFGPSSNLHGEHIGLAKELCGIDLSTDSMAALDLEHSNFLFGQLQSEWKARFGANQGQTVDTTKPIAPVTPNPSTPTVPPIITPNPKPSNPSSTQENNMDISTILNTILSITTRLDSLDKKLEVINSLDNKLDQLLSFVNRSDEGVVKSERQWWIDQLNKEVESLKLRRPGIAKEIEAIVNARK